jgi:hypothetical protein
MLEREGEGEREAVPQWIGINSVLKSNNGYLNLTKACTSMDIL